MTRREGDLYEADPHEPESAPVASPGTAAVQAANAGKPTLTTDQFCGRIFDEPEKPKRYILEAAELESLDRGRRAWWFRISVLCQQVYDLLGQEAGAAALAKAFPRDWDPLRSPSRMQAFEVSLLGMAVRKLLPPDAEVAP